MKKALFLLMSASLASVAFATVAEDMLPSCLIEVESTYDQTRQKCYFYAPEKAQTEAVPLIVGLHAWSFTYEHLYHYGVVLEYALAHGWAMVGPNCRGANDHPEACGGEPAVQDVVDAVNYAKAHAKIDPKRIFITGESGGGHMTLLMAGRHPEIWAGCAAGCPITDLARWYEESLESHAGRDSGYATKMRAACGGTPAEKPEEYAQRSPLTHLAAAKTAGVPIYIVTGIHDGWVGPVPVGHAIRGFNALAAENDRLSEDSISAIETQQTIPAALTGENAADVFYPTEQRIHFRRTSGNVQLTIFEGGHSGNFPAHFNFFEHQEKGTPADFSLPQPEVNPSQPSDEEGDSEGVATSSPGLEPSWTTSGEREQPIDLSETWVTNAMSLTAPYSAIGWGVDGEDSREGSVTLSLVPVGGTGSPVPLASGLSGRGDIFLDLNAFDYGDYRFLHEVAVGGAVVAARTLEGVFSFVAPYSESELRAAVETEDSDETRIINDKTNYWSPIAGAGDGVQAPVTGTSRFTFVVRGGGAFTFSYGLVAGSLEVVVDGRSVTLDAADAWSDRTLLMLSPGSHTITFVSVPAEGGRAAVKNVTWRSDGIFARAEGAPVGVDLREGPVLQVRNRKALLPIVYSSTNFTGCAGSTLSSKAKVTAVRLTGTGDDVSTWTEEVPGTSRVLVEKTGDGAIVLKGVEGGSVWKVTHQIFEKEELLREDSRILDLRKYVASGLVFFVN